MGDIYRSYLRREHFLNVHERNLTFHTVFPRSFFMNNRLLHHLYDLKSRDVTIDSMSKIRKIYTQNIVMVYPFSFLSRFQLWIPSQEPHPWKNLDLPPSPLTSSNPQTPVTPNSSPIGMYVVSFVFYL